MGDDDGRAFFVGVTAVGVFAALASTVRIASRARAELQFV
jgi:hypothetical protein